MKLLDLEMLLETIIDFKEKKNIDIIMSGRENYRIFIILSVVGNGYKLLPLLIIKGELGKSIEKELRSLPYVKDKKIVIYCQPDA